MGFWGNLKNKINEINDKTEQWFDKNVNQNIEEEKQEYEKELVCKKCGGKLKNNVLKEKIICEYCGTEQENPKYLFLTEENKKEDDKEDK